MKLLLIPALLCAAYGCAHHYADWSAVEDSMFKAYKVRDPPLVDVQVASLDQIAQACAGAPVHTPGGVRDGCSRHYPRLGFSLVWVPQSTPEEQCRVYGHELAHVLAAHGHLRLDQPRYQRVEELAARSGCVH